MSNIFILGSGMIGSAIAFDLSSRHNVTIADINPEALNRVKSKAADIETLEFDVSDKTRLQNTVTDFDLVVCAVPGFLGFESLKTIIESGIDVIDISFSSENVLSLNSSAKSNNVTAIVDCGVAPGLDNLLLGYYDQKLKLTDFECLVGGLPKVKKWPFCYKAPFSPVDVIEEYIRPARYMVNGTMVTKEPLSDCEFVEFEQVGTLESFNTDGLRSILTTMSHIPNLKEKTLRYPGHVEYIQVLKKSGFFDEEPLSLNGQKISPLQFSAKVLTDEWKLDEHEEEFTIMRVTLKGKNGRDQTENIVYELYDEYCRKTNVSSMARTTGYTAAAAANMILDGRFTSKGVFPPELIGPRQECFDYIIGYLEERNVNFSKTVTND